ncbi:hypothetical protein ACFPH8_10465 [Bizionia hallyeonensis]|uniref:Bor protein n=1 Tax=Bizionia hallyeonensis TaxID=1123757 RepID=A0ABW0C927_9FLAO
MMKKNPYPNTLSGIFLMLAMLFALSPCSAKETFLGTMDIDFQRPAHKTIASHVYEICQLTTVDGFEVVKTTELQTLKLIATKPSINVADLSLYVQPRIGINYRKKTSGLSPPLYILYQCLKLDTTATYV